MERALRIAVAGLGRLGRRHAEIFRWRVRGAEVVAAASPVAEEREWARSTLGIGAVVADYRDLLALPQVDAWPGWPEGRLALVGPAGSGKTHLARAWAARADAVVIAADEPQAPDLPALRGRPRRQRLATAG